ncbi:MAG: hypothetical protein KAT17_06030 [Candidatus Aminicenantes bacterium]|nr:hypothetical protein [Candidatus Aminicenantes bacterium]
MEHKKIFFFLFFLATALLQYGWINEKNDAEKTKVVVFSSLFDNTVSHLGLFYTYFVNQKTELGWGVNFYSYNNEENYLKGKNLTLGPMWAHTIVFNKSNIGLRITFNLWISLFSSLTTIEEEEDVTKFTVSADPQILLFKEIKLGKNLRAYPAIGVAACLTYMQRTEYDEMQKGLLESRLIISLPVKIKIKENRYIMLEPTAKIFLYSNRNDTIEKFSIQLAYIF